MKQRDFVYLRIPGGIIGMNIDYMNSKIDYYNYHVFPFLYSHDLSPDFWEWFRYEEGDEYYYGIFGFNNESVISKIHKIRGI